MQLWERSFPWLRVNTVKMPALHDETSKRSRMWLFPQHVLHHLSPSSFFFVLLLACIYRRTVLHTLSQPLTFLSGTLRETIVSAQETGWNKPDLLHTLRCGFMSLTDLNCIWQQSPFQKDCIWHCLGTRWHYFIKLSLTRGRKLAGRFLASFASLSCLTFKKYGPALMEYL